MTGHPLADVQNEKPAQPLAIERVGVRGLHALASLACAGACNPIPVLADLAVSLPASRRGTHMSRLVQCLQGWDGKLAAPSLRELLLSMQTRLEAENARADFTFSLYLDRAAPASGLVSRMAYPCSLGACLSAASLRFRASVQAPVMTVCPCSLAICVEGAHSQRALVSIGAAGKAMPDLNALIRIAESAGSAPVRPLLKREDEKAITELAFASPAFVEDAARRAATALIQDAQAQAWKVEVASMESIHNHDAYAVITSPDWAEN